MTYRFRNDEPGAWHHVMNRGLSKRPIFEGPKDYRYFIACMGWAMHSGRLEVHAYSLLDNHFHLLVRSPLGKLSHAMQQIESSYVLWFNRRYHRDGPLFRGRFHSKRIETDLYWRAVVRYIDRNPMESGAVTSPELYPYGSAHHFARHSGPRWLHRRTIERIVKAELGTDSYSPQDYFVVFHTDVSSSQIEFMHRSLNMAKDPAASIDKLTTCESGEVRNWLVSQAARADGSKPGIPVLSGAVVMDEIGRLQSRGPETEFWYKGRLRNCWPIITAGLLRTVCGLSLREVSGWTDCSVSTASRMVYTHSQLLQSDQRYAQIAQDIFAATLKIEWPDTAKRRLCLFGGLT